MPLPTDLENLLAIAGKARANECDRLYHLRGEDEARRVAQVAAEVRAGAAARANASAIWSWLTSPEGDDLRASMRANGLTRARLGVLGVHRGEWRRSEARGFGSVSFDVLADAVALRVDIVRGYHGGSSRRVASALELLNVAPALALDALANELRAGRALQLAKAFLSLTPLADVELLQ